MDNHKESKGNLIRKKLINRETIVYLIAGIMTTLVNIFAYGLLCNVFGINYLVANLIAWIFAVIFAYIVNNLWVFRDKSDSLKVEGIKLIKFIVARAFSLLIEEAGLFLLVKVAGFNNMAVKVFLAVVVIVLNYLFSKLYIFKGNQKESGNVSS